MKEGDREDKDPRSDKRLPKLNSGRIGARTYARGDQTDAIYDQRMDCKVAPSELELQREAEIAHNRFYDKPDERGWIRQACCGTICALRSSPPPRPDYKEWRGGHPLESVGLWQEYRFG